MNEDSRCVSEDTEHPFIRCMRKKGHVGPHRASFAWDKTRAEIESSRESADGKGGTEG